MKLHLVCGPRFIPGVVHVDAQGAPHVDIIVDPVECPPMADNSVSLIYANHVLEHFGRNEYEAVLRKWLRVLGSWEIFRLAVLDFAACAAIYYKSSLADGLSGLVCLTIGGQRNEHDFHKMIFDSAFLSRSLLEISFRKVRRWDWRTTEHAHINDYSRAYLPRLDKENGRLMSLNIEAVK